MIDRLVKGVVDNAKVISIEIIEESLCSGESRLQPGMVDDTIIASTGTQQGFIQIDHHGSAFIDCERLPFKDMLKLLCQSPPVGGEKTLDFVGGRMPAQYGRGTWSFIRDQGGSIPSADIGNIPKRIAVIEEGVSNIQ